MQYSNFEIKEVLEDYNQPRQKSTISLCPDKQLYPHKELYPIKWSGFINNDKIEIVQPFMYSSSVNDYEFNSFHEKYNHLKYDVIKLIHKKLNTLN